jgi:hypothetical protein
MRKLYLHIGTEKTGTTSIQNFLHANKTVLSRSGYHVLECAGEKNHRAVPSYCMKDGDYDDFFFRRQIDNPKNKKIFKEKLFKDFNEEMGSLENNIHSVIITSEHFHSRLKSIESVKIFKRLISDYFNEIQIICYIREQSALASALYSTGIKAGDNVEFNSFIKDISPDSSLYDYYSLLGRWSDVFSNDSLNVRIFSKDEFYNNNLIDDFCVAIDEGLLTITDRNITKKNESLSNFGILVGRALNSISSRYYKDGSINKNRRHAFKQISKFFSGPENNINIEQYKRIRNIFEVSNQKVSQKYFNGRDHLFPWKALPVSTTVINENQIRAVASIISNYSSVSLNSEVSVNLLRDSALLLENIDLNKAYQLMRLAHQGRPEGQFIKRKIEEYEKRL